MLINDRFFRHMWSYRLYRRYCGIGAGSCASYIHFWKPVLKSALDNYDKWMITQIGQKMIYFIILLLKKRFILGSKIWTMFFWRFLKSYQFLNIFSMWNFSKWTSNDRGYSDGPVHLKQLFPITFFKFNQQKLNILIQRKESEVKSRIFALVSTYGRFYNRASHSPSLL